jgi:hypothetical protein
MSPVWRSGLQTHNPSDGTRFATSKLMCVTRPRDSKVNRTTNACQKENERISTRPFLPWHFSPGDKIQNCPAQFLAVSWIIHVELKLHRLRPGLA